MGPMGGAGLTWRAALKYDPRAMSGSSDERRSALPFLVAVGVVAVAVTVAVVARRQPEREARPEAQGEQVTSGQRHDREQARSVLRHGASSEPPEERASDEPAAEPRPEGQGEPSSENASGGASLSAPRRSPLDFQDRRLRSGAFRFVARYGSSARMRPDAAVRTKAEARSRVESARRRIAAGEDPIAIIREASDPPTGIGPSVVDRYDALPEGELSPIVELEDGFVLFIGSPRPAPPPGAGI
jgi:hypothetical protein